MFSRWHEFNLRDTENSFLHISGGRVTYYSLIMPLTNDTRERGTRLKAVYLVRGT